MKGIAESLEYVRITFFKNGISEMPRTTALIEGESWKRRSKENTYTINSILKR